MNKKQLVYVLWNPLTKMSKIGITMDLQKRVQQVQCACGCKLDICYSSHLISKARHYEGVLHDRFADHRTFGEWFDLDPKFIIPTVKKLIPEELSSEVIEKMRETKSISEIAKEFNISRQSVYARIRKKVEDSGLPLPNLDPVPQGKRVRIRPNVYKYDNCYSYEKWESGGFCEVYFWTEEEALAASK